MKPGLAAVPLLAAIVAISSHAENDVKLASAESEFLAKADQESVPGESWRRHLEIWQRINPEARGGSGGIAAVAPAQQQFASGCSQ